MGEVGRHRGFYCDGCCGGSHWRLINNWSTDRTILNKRARPSLPPGRGGPPLWPLCSWHCNRSGVGLEECLYSGLSHCPVLRNSKTGRPWGASRSMPVRRRASEIFAGVSTRWRDDWGVVNWVNADLVTHICPRIWTAGIIATTVWTHVTPEELWLVHTATQAAGCRRGVRTGRLQAKVSRRGIWADHLSQERHFPGHLVSLAFPATDHESPLQHWPET